MKEISPDEWAMACDLYEAGFFKTEPRALYPCDGHTVVINGVRLTHPIAASVVGRWAEYRIDGAEHRSHGRVLIIPTEFFMALRPHQPYGKPPPCSESSARCRKPRNKIEALLFNPFHDFPYRPAEFRGL